MLRWIALGLSLMLAGCSRSVPQEELDRATEAVRVGLNAWKNGDMPAKLKNAEPPVTFSDDEWSNGKFKLLAFEIKKTEGKPNQPLRCTVQLTLQDRRGKKLERDAVYEVRNGSPAVVARDPYY